MEIEIYQLPEAAHYYPTPKAPMLPLFDSSNLAFNGTDGPCSRFLSADAIFTPSGRLALYYSLKLLGTGPGDEVLLPAYHCGSMLEPIIWLGATPVFYHLDRELMVSSQTIRETTSSHTKALLLPHFFGFPQDTTAVKACCNALGIYLIEDCAHSFFSKAGGVSVGNLGDFSITSTVKFFPGVEGGALVCNNASVQPVSRLGCRPAISAQLKSIFHTMQASAAYGRLGWLGRLLKNNKKTANSVCLTNLETSSERTTSLNKNNLIWFDPQKIGTGTTWFSRFIPQHSGSKELIRKRIRHYNYYQDRLRQQPGVSLLHDSLPEGAVPYIFPLILSNPQKHFPLLKQQGVPIWRWEELAVTDCSVSQDYRLKLIQLPCHQSLEQNELEWIIDTLIETVSNCNEE